ncbi:MAG: hypothetical protein NTV06_05105 [candidate division Zixibacteria bacterium]|nr:hypothetical protein [candidate division Zixibacteria bacterium]
MLPDTRNLIVIAVLTVGAYFFLRRLWRILSSNLQLIAGLLHGEINYPVLNLPVCFVVEGLYKGRKVTCYCNPLGSRYGDAKFSIEPSGGLHKSSFLSLAKDGPINGTYIVGNKIYCEEPVSTAPVRSMRRNRASLLSPINKQDLIAYLDQLSVAAEQVENGACRTTTSA